MFDNNSQANKPVSQFGQNAYSFGNAPTTQSNKSDGQFGQGGYSFGNAPVRRPVPQRSRILSVVEGAGICQDALKRQKTYLESINEHENENTTVQVPVPILPDFKYQQARRYSVAPTTNLNQQEADDLTSF